MEHSPRYEGGKWKLFLELNFSKRGRPNKDRVNTNFLWNSQFFGVDRIPLLKKTKPDEGLCVCGEV